MPTDKLREKTDTTIDQPIFVIGCGRSGSTLLYDLLCVHSDLAWFSNFTTRFRYWTFLAKLSQLYYLRLQNNFPKYLLKAIPKPSEGYELWDSARSVVNSPSDPPLTRADANSGDKAHIDALILKHLKYQNGIRFINKNTRNTRRIGYLDALFPDAQFVHIVRDPRASVASLLKVSWWPSLEIWNHDWITPAVWIAQGNDPVILAAELWRDETKLVLEKQDSLSNRYFRVLYETLIANPQETLRKVLDFCNLHSYEHFFVLVEMFNIKNMNYKYKVDLLPEQQTIIKEITAPILEEMGCEYN